MAGFTKAHDESPGQSTPSSTSQIDLEPSRPAYDELALGADVAPPSADSARELRQVFGHDDVEHTARAGVEGASSELPHRDTIQQAFGKHDVSNIATTIGGSAARSTTSLGAEAYTVDDRIGFAQQPDLHTAAHEAAHVVQQQRGVAFKGLDTPGDAYESHADRVADAVVAGRSAEHLLGQMPAGTGAGSAVQRKPTKEQQHNTSNVASLAAAEASLRLLAKDFHEASTKIDSAKQMDTSGEAGDGPKRDIVAGARDRVSGETTRINTLIGGLGLDDVSRQTLAGAVKQVKGANFMFTNTMNSVGGFMENAAKDAQDLRHVVTGFDQAIGFDKDTKLDENRKAPEESQKKLVATAVGAHMEAAMDAVSSVGDGNPADSKRVLAHIGELASLGTDNPGALSKKDVDKITRAARGLEKTHPELKNDLEAKLAKLKLASKKH